MSLWIPPPSQQWTVENLATQPAGGTGSRYGTDLTPGVAANGAWTQLVAAGSVTEDIYGISLWFTSNFGATANVPCCVDIGANNSGGALAGGDIPIISDLITGQVVNVTGVGAGINYFFPVFIPAGSNIAGRAEATSATNPVACSITTYGSPKDPSLVKAGSKSLVYGNVDNRGIGTSVTPGTTANGAWVSLGTTTADHFFWQLGVFWNTSACQGTSAFADLAVGNTTQNEIIIRRAVFMADTNENQSFRNHPAWFHVPSGTEIVGRMQTGNSTTTGWTMMAYGVCS